MLLQARWPLRRGLMGFNLVATVVASVTIIAVWCLVHDVGSAEVSLWDVAESDCIPLSAVVLFRFACAAVVLYTLVCVYCDPEGLELQYLDAQVHLRRHSRWTTFTVWCFTLLFCYFTLATLCSSAALVGHGGVVPAAVVMATLVLFEVSYPMSILVTAVVTFVLFPVARRTNYPMGRMFRWRPLIMHNGNVLMMQLAMLMAPPPVRLAHLPYAVLFGCCYAIFAWCWFLRSACSIISSSITIGPMPFLCILGYWSPSACSTGSAMVSQSWHGKRAAAGGHIRALCWLHLGSCASASQLRNAPTSHEVPWQLEGFCIVTFSIH